MILKTLDKNLEICFVEHLLNVMIKSIPSGFVCLLETQYMIGNAFLLRL